MQLRFFDYLVLIVAYMFVSLRGDKLMNVLKFNKLSGAIPLNRAGSSALLHALLFVLILVVLNTLAAKIAGASGLPLGMTPLDQIGKTLGKLVTGETADVIVTPQIKSEL